MKISLKYIYITGIVGLMSFATNYVSACDPGLYNRGTMGCVSMFCIGHSDAYCEDVKNAKSKAEVRNADIKECMGEYFDSAKGSDKKRGDKLFCQCIADGGTELAVAIPFVSVIGKDNFGRCVPKAAAGEAVPRLIYSIIQIFNTVLLVGGFIALIYAGILYTTQGFGNESKLKEAKTIIWGVMGAFALYGTLGMILRFINPNIFK